jgi:conjugal transfer pilus assembly protein TraE
MFKKTFVKDRGQAITISNRLALAVLIMTAMLCYTTISAIQKDSIVVVVPPYLDERVEIAFNAASKSFHQKYALYAAVLIGNTNPDNVHSIVSALSHTFSPALYHEVKADLMLQADSLKNSNTTLAFHPNMAMSEYNPATNLIYIPGKQIIRDQSGTPRAKVVTYEFELTINNYVPSITHFARYDGEPKINQPTINTAG